MRPVARPETRRLRLDAWVRRALFRSAIAPLLVVEAVLIVIYLLAVNHAHDRNIETTRTIAVEELRRIAEREAALVSRRLEGIARITEIFGASVRQALIDRTPPSAEERARYTFSPTGPWHTRHDPEDAAHGRCSVYYSALSPITEEERETALTLAVLDDDMNRILAAAPLVSQIYFNSNDSMNRICPPFDVMSQYAPQMNIPSYNFYYLADLAHNPSRRAVWTDAYVDPAGQGWMASSVAPVYAGDHLEGVVGLDVTLESLASEILDLDLPWEGYGVLVARDGTILAMPEAAERDFGLKELKTHHYASAILQDTFKPDAYNVFKREDLAPLGRALGAGEAVTTLALAESRIVSWDTIDGPGWFLVVIVPETAVLAPSQALDDDLRAVGYWMIGGVALFYVAFLLLILGRSRHLAASISGPLADMDRAVDAIGRGEFHLDVARHPVIELERTMTGLVSLGATLGEASERIEATRAELERQAASLQAIIDAVPAPVFFAGPSGALTGANSAYRRLAETIGSARLDALVTSLSRAREKSAYEGLLWRSGSGDDARDYLVRLATLPAGREAPGTIGVLVDVSAQEQARELAERARDTALTASRLKTEFLASVSHEIRTPMNGIIGMTELLDDPGLSDEQREFVRVIRESAEALLVIINDILDFSRLEAGRISLRIDDFDPELLVRSVVSMLGPRAAAKSLALTVDLQPSTPAVGRSDAGRLRQVLLNLVGNALKFTDRGEVRVEVGGLERGGHVWLRVAVTDTGPGIAPHLQHRLFLPFSQLDGSDTREHGGTGLGLSISKRLVEALGGEIGCTSHEGAGATFWFEVPVTAA